MGSAQLKLTPHGIQHVSQAPRHVTGVLCLFLSQFNRNKKFFAFFVPRMDAIKHAAASLKAKVTGHKHDDQEKKVEADKVSHEPRAEGAAAHPDPPTHGHAKSARDPPGAPGIIETPAPGVAGAGTQGPGLMGSRLPRI
ncbi:unnamed protein product [Calypogeia fissa]